MKVEYISHMGDDLSPVNAARVSFDKVSEWEVVDGRPEGYLEERLAEKDSKLIHYLAKHKHTSCFEHQTATLRLKVPIFIARQIQRHRTFAYNEISRRYVDNPPEFFWPDAWRKRAENVKQGSSDEVMEKLPEVGFPFYDLDKPDSHVESIVDANGRTFVAQKLDGVGIVNLMVGYYELVLSQGMAPELARMLLPQNMYTEFYMTGNLRNWAHFLALRLDGHAQLEVQQVARDVADILHPLFPVSMDALTAHGS